LRAEARRLEAQVEAYNSRMRRKIALLYKFAEESEANEEEERAGGEQQSVSRGGEHEGREHELHGSAQDGTVNRMQLSTEHRRLLSTPPKTRFSAEHILAISKAKTRKDRAANNVKTDALVEAAQKNGMSLRALCRALTAKLKRKVPASRLSMARDGLRPIDKDIAKAIEELTGFESSTKNWPRGFV
jgi:hypothetical protein